MPLSPEITTIPGMIGSFTRAGLTVELVTALTKGQKGRSMVEDSRRLMEQFEKESPVKITGIENFPLTTGTLLVFNHPNMDVLLPAILELVIKIQDLKGAKTKIMMGSEIPLFGKFNESSPLPGSISFIRRFHDLYSDNIISVPMSKGRKDYESGRFMALRNAVTALKKGDTILVSPEGHVEEDNKISQISTFHKGSGGLSIIAAKIGVPTVPVGIWREKGERRINLSVGAPYLPDITDELKSATLAMYKISKVLPNNLRGPFIDP